MPGALTLHGSPQAHGAASSKSSSPFAFVHQVGVLPPHRLAKAFVPEGLESHAMMPVDAIDGCGRTPEYGHGAGYVAPARGEVQRCHAERMALLRGVGSVTEQQSNDLGMHPPTCQVQWSPTQGNSLVAWQRDLHLDVRVAAVLRQKRVYDVGTSLRSSDHQGGVSCRTLVGRSPEAHPPQPSGKLFVGGSVNRLHVAVAVRRSRTNDALALDQ
mmetsp:Transcript_34100/g.89937  ORF Transcript_34100/g.89937 Transcript_34100/m.89937 type:complete len:214 (-) Transcript_34100:1951-2592(-)